MIQNILKHCYFKELPSNYIYTFRIQANFAVRNNYFTILKSTELPWEFELRLITTQGFGIFAVVA